MPLQTVITVNFIDTSMRIKGIRPIKASDHATISDWYRQYDQILPHPSSLSTTGFICDGRVALWIYLTNSNMAILEGLIADKNSVPSLRRSSINKLVGFAVDFCVAAGYTQIMAITKHPSVDEIGKRYGFKTLKSHKILYLKAD